MPTRSEAIKAFLNVKAEADLASLYSIEMECQVNVGQDGGERIDGEFKGRKWHGWSDGLTSWKSFRIPYKADSEPEYEDKELRFDLAAHAEGIGMTGWNWKRRCSQWVAFDFDAIIGHSEKHQTKLTNDQLESVRKAAEQIDWVTVRLSSSGKGLHLYVFLEDVETRNHTEHAALARAILGKMSALVGFDFQSKVDICGGNMWVWHRKCLDTDGFKLIKAGKKLPASEVPPHWRDHVKVVTRKSRKNLPQDIGDPASFDELSSQRPKTPLDEEHKRLIQYLKETNALWWWDQDHWMLVTHTYHLQEAYKKLGLRGYFNTMSEGREKGSDHNCFLFPLRRGGWTVRRYSLGVQEHPSWDQDGAGWTRCYLNREADLGTAARAYGGMEDPSGGFVFREADKAVEAARILGVTLNVGEPQKKRQAKLKQHKDGRLVAEIENDQHDRADEMEGWLAKKGKWTRIFNTNYASPDEPDIANYDDLIRHLVTESHEDYGWTVKSDGTWRTEPLAHIRVALASMGFSAKEVSSILGASIFKPWRIVNRPFQPEYPGDREWNRNAAQFRFLPNKDKDNLSYPTWSKILNHCGQGLNEAVQNDTWCKANGLVTGGDYLKCWIASLFQEPLEHLPYLFFYGPQNSGKSIFHESLELLLTKGYQRADVALTNQSAFNGELEGALICVVEETDLRKNKMAYNRIKDAVTSGSILIHKKNQTPYHVPNSTHWIQCSNDHNACPVFAGDSRITMCYVDELDPLELIPKKELIPLLEKEAVDFTTEILHLEIPRSPDRLNIPILETHEKNLVQAINQTPIETFISEYCIRIEGYSIKFSELYLKFQEWCEVNGEICPGKIKFGREMPPHYPKGRMHGTGQYHIGNIAWREDDVKPINKKYILKGDYLEHVTN